MLRATWSRVSTIVDVKQVVRNAFNRCGYDLVRYREPIDHPIDLLGLLLREQLDRGPFFFLQVGANDGVRTDPLRALVLKYHLRGLLIEPLPDQFERLVRNYAGESQLRFENCAIADADGERDLYRVRSGAPVPDWAHGLASFNRRNLSGQRQGIPGLDAYVETTRVRTRSLTSIVRQHRIELVSMLVVDTEGFDYEVVRSAFEARLLPAIIMYEHVHLPPAKQRDCSQLLKSNGYRFLELGMDTYAVRAEGAASGA